MRVSSTEFATLNAFHCFHGPARSGLSNAAKASKGSCACRRTTIRQISIYITAIVLASRLVMLRSSAAWWDCLPPASGRYRDLTSREWMTGWMHPHFHTIKYFKHPYITHNMLHYLQYSAHSRLIRRFQFHFALPAIQVQMFHVSNENRLCLIEIDERNPRLVELYAICVVTVLSLCLARL